MSDTTIEKESSKPPSASHGGQAPFWSSPVGLSEVAITPLAPPVPLGLGLRALFRTMAFLVVACITLIAIWLRNESHTEQAATQPPHELTGPPVISTATKMAAAGATSPADGQPNTPAPSPSVVADPSPSSSVVMAPSPTVAPNIESMVAKAAPAPRKMRPQSKSPARSSPSTLMPVPGATGPGQVVDRRLKIEGLIQRACRDTVLADTTIEVGLDFYVVDKVVVDANLLDGDSNNSARCARNVALREVKAIWPVTDGNGKKQYKFTIKGPAAK
jgi:hypothetical protein